MLEFADTYRVIFSLSLRTIADPLPLPKVYSKNIQQLINWSPTPIMPTNTTQIYCFFLITKNSKLKTTAKKNVSTN